jgi:hypothetical protein
MIDNIELFHLGDTDVRIFEPIHEFLPRSAYPGDSDRRDALQRKMQVDYEDAYDDQIGVIRGKWPEIERYLTEMRRYIHTYAGEVFEIVLGHVRARVLGERRGD